jgi:hypothetical protein
MMDGAEWLCQFSEGAVQGISQGPSPQEVLVTVELEGVICCDAQSKVKDLGSLSGSERLRRSGCVLRQGSHFSTSTAGVLPHIVNGCYHLATFASQEKAHLHMVLLHLLRCSLYALGGLLRGR